MHETIGATLLALLLAPAAAPAPDKPAYDSSAAGGGAETYRVYCVSCHGKEGRGDGPLASSLRVAPADLTGIARRNHGEYPFEKVSRIIDGRQHVTGHGNSDMPVWGDAFLAAHDGYDPEKVKEKIRGLAHYLASLQQPPLRP